MASSGPRGPGVALRGSLLAMPMIVINMGVEMVYILEQRLKAQAISSEKSHKVLADVVRTMYSPKFIAELFKPQEVYTNRATRQIFDRLAHSSIMRLNKNSMDKLYDLMTMGFKYQLLRCTCPSQILHVALNHLEALKRIVAEPAVAELVDAAIRQCAELYSRLPLGELFALQLTLARFFQDRRVKVSLFLQDGIQNMDGTMVLSVAGPLPPGTEPPGTVRYFDAHGRPAGGVDRVPALLIPGAVPASPADSSLGLAGDGARVCRLGENLYAKERSGKPAGPPGAAAAGAGAPAGGGTAGIVPPAPEPALSGSVAAEPYEPTITAAADGKEGFEDPVDGGRHARAALDLLSSLLGGAGGGGEGGSGAFKLALFSGDDGSYTGGSGGFDDGSGGAVISFDARDAARLAEMMKRLGLDDLDEKPAGGSAAARRGKGGVGVGGGGKEADDDDLLAMMDAAVGASDSKK